jgi:hypothetical protein
MCNDYGNCIEYAAMVGPSVAIRSAPFGQGLSSGRYPEPLFGRAVALPSLLLTTSDFDAGRAPRLRAGFSGCLLPSRCLRADACLQRPRVKREHALGRVQFAEPARKLFALSIDARQTRYRSAAFLFGERDEYWQD